MKFPFMVSVCMLKCFLDEPKETEENHFSEWASVLRVLSN